MVLAIIVEEEGAMSDASMRALEEKLDSNDSFRDRVLAEIRRVRSKQQPFHSAHEAFAVLLEEVEEFKAEVWTKRRNEFNMLHELVQIAAVAEMMAQDMDLVEREESKDDRYRSRMP